MATPRLAAGEPRREDERLVVVRPLVDGLRAEERAQLRGSPARPPPARPRRRANIGSKNGPCASRVAKRSASPWRPSVRSATSSTPSAATELHAVGRVLVGHEPGAVRVLAVLGPKRGDVRPSRPAVDDRPVADLEEDGPRLPHERDEEGAGEVAALPPLGGAAAAIRARTRRPTRGRSRGRRSEVRLGPRPSAGPGRRTASHASRAPSGARSEVPAPSAATATRSDPPLRGGAGPRDAQASAQGSPAATCDVPTTDAASVRQARRG